MKFNTRHLSAVGCAFLLHNTVAHAYTYKYTCNGCPGSVGGTTVCLSRNTFSMPNGYPQTTALSTAENEWNSTDSGVTSWAPATVCTTNSAQSWSNTDGVWMVALVAQSQLGGNNIGSTVYRTGICFIGCNDFDEEDMLYASNLNFSNPDESGITNPPPMGLDTIVHEWGHLLGLGHQSGFDMMNAAGADPYVGGVGSHVTPLGDDRRGASSIYGSPAAFKNLAASAQWWNTNNSTVSPTQYVGTIYSCPGFTESWLFNAANQGTSTLQFNQRMFLATCPNCYSTGVVVFDWLGGSVAGKWSGYWSVTAPFPTIPKDTTYWTMHRVDSSSQHAETREWDNTVHNANTWISPSNSCP